MSNGSSPSSSGAGTRRGLLLALGALARVGEEVRVARLFDLDGLGLFLVKAGGDDGNDDLVIKGFVKARAEDDVGFRMRCALHEHGGRPRHRRDPFPWSR